MFEKLDLGIPAGFVRSETAAPCLMVHVHDFAEHVELQLGMRGIADAHRRRSLITRQPVDNPFGQPALAGDAVHDLQLVGAAGNGAQQPFAPRLGFLVVACMHRPEQRQGGVAQPAKTIIPVPHAAHLLGQRGGGRGDDPAGRGIGQGLERNQRAHHRIGAMSGGPASLRPALPARFGIFEGGLRIGSLGRQKVRRRVGEDERHRISRRDREFADGCQILADELRGGPKHHHIRTGDSAQRLVFELGDPGNDSAITEAQDKLRPHLDPATLAEHEANDA